MKNSRLVASIVLTILLCISLAYWALQLIRPAERPLAAPPQAKQDINLDAAAELFGGRSKGTSAPSNYQLRGVVYSSISTESVAIIAPSGKPAQAVAVGAEFLPGVTVAEVHPKYVLISENGATKRLELPEKAPPSTGASAPASSPAQPAQTPLSASQAQQATPPPPKMIPPAAQTPAAPGVTIQQPGQPAQNVPAQSVPSQNGSAGTGAQPAQPAQNVPASVQTIRANRSNTGTGVQTPVSQRRV